MVGLSGVKYLKDILGPSEGYRAAIATPDHLESP